MQQTIEIKPMGSYFETDSNGYLINPTSKEKIQEKWQPVVADLIHEYQKAYGDKLHSIYIRGSVAKGQAVDGVSDIDTFAYVELPKEEITHDWVKDAEKQITSKYDFVSEAEMGASPVSEFQDDMIILNQSICVWGKELEVLKLKIDNKLAIHSPNFHKRIEWFERFLEKDESEEEIKRGCVWLMKGLLRVGLEITLEKSHKYTRDLYRCYETFSENYPEREVEMKEALYLALNPTVDKTKIKSVMDNLGVWLLKETQKISW